MNSQVQNFVDSFCRCFGHPPNPPTATGLGSTSAASQPISATHSHSSAKRRANRLELKDKQWDELFEKKNQGQNISKSPPASDVDTTDLGTAHAVAQAKLAANPSRRHATKRKRSTRSKEDIFRGKKASTEACASAQHAPDSKTTPFTRLLHPSLAMCFATPVRGASEEEEQDVKSLDNSDNNTLNTCEDTITSTVVFENKYRHLVETRPPMPLFNQFKIGHSQDEIRNIMATDSHSSARMLRMMQQQQQQQRQQPVQLDDSSVDSESRRKARRPNECVDYEMEDVPDVKAVSSSTDSSRQSHHARQFLS